jgi:hypothetical protein
MREVKRTLIQAFIAHMRPSMNCQINVDPLWRIARDNSSLVGVRVVTLRARHLCVPTPPAQASEKWHLAAVDPRRAHRTFSGA